MKKVLFLSALTLVLSQNAYANQSYTLMDKDENGIVTHQEFFEANPNFSEMAFQIIDKDKNKEVTLEEWLGFVEMHSRPEGFMEEMKSSTVPAKDGPDAPSSPSMPSMPSMDAMQQMQKMKETTAPTNPTTNTPSVENIGELPLLSPPKVKEAPVIATPKVEAPSVPQVQAPTTPTVESAGNMDDLPLLTPNKK